MAKTWDYLVEEIKITEAAELSEKINELAEYGWELVTVQMPFYYFRRVHQTIPSMP